MMARTLLATFVAAVLSWIPAVSAQPPTTAAASDRPSEKLRQLTIANKPWTGDFDRMLERRVIRVNAPYSRSLFFSDKGRERGLAAELMRDFERYVNIKYAKQLGVMQLMPGTGQQMNVGDIKAIEPNIHAGAKYMDMLMTKYFSDAHFSEGNRPLFAFASYNAGPGNIARMRKEAARRGLDPDRWFNNVEIVVGEKIGGETTTYGTSTSTTSPIA